MIKKPEVLTKLSNPNDESPSGCYAPVESGNPNDKKKRHFNEGEAPTGWLRVQCNDACFLKR